MPHTGSTSRLTPRVPRVAPKRSAAYSLPPWARAAGTISCQIAALAAKNGTDEQVLAIQAAAYAMAGAKAPSQNDRSFHEVIAQASGNAALMALVSHLWAIHDNSPIFTRLDEHIATEPVWQQAELEHLGIVDAILSRNPGRAQQAMHAHLTRILDRLHRNLPDDDDDG